MNNTERKRPIQIGKRAQRKLPAITPVGRLPSDHGEIDYALSVRQPHAERLISGEKVVEYRTWIPPSWAVGTRVWVYATSTYEEGGEDLPCRIIVGSVRLGGVQHLGGGEYAWSVSEPMRADDPGFAFHGTPQPKLWMPHRVIG